MLVTASPAVADGPCPANQLCLYDGRHFTGNRIISRSTNACFYPQDVSDRFRAIMSYDNNLPVHAMVWSYRYDTGGYSATRAMPTGGFSSDNGGTNLGAFEMDQVCMGHARP
ncbi:peptidase inhibitor family I36 protein [Nonomuraea antimicrobica]